MYLKAATLDDLLGGVFQRLLKSKTRLTATKGDNVEISGVALELTQPRARLSRTEIKGHLFSCLGEFFWYISCSNRVEPMEYYLSRYKEFAQPDGTIWGAYGPRIFGGENSQYERVINILRERPTSRKAVIQLFDRLDIEKDYEDVPCTCTLQFLQRDGVLHLVTHMRSNDAYWGLPHDVFSFTMVQEIMAAELGYKLGSYKHLVGSLHLYDRHREKVEQFLGEGLQATAAMPAMPKGSQWTDIKRAFLAESTLRIEGEKALTGVLEQIDTLDSFWKDLALLLCIYRLTKGFEGRDDNRLRQVVGLQNQLSSTYYRTYTRRRSRRLEAMAQPDLIRTAEEKR